MEYGLSPLELLSRGRADLRMGVPVVLSHGDTRFVVLPVETASAARLEGLHRLGKPVVALTARRAQTLKARAYDGDLVRLNIPKGAGLDWVRALADPSGDLQHPMKGPFDELREGDAAPARAGIALAKSARLLPAVLIAELSQELPDLTDLALDDLEPLFDKSPIMHDVVSARLPVAAAGETRLHVFRPEDGGEEHYAIEVGTPARDLPVLARLHSACFTGDILGSLKCDCGPQLNGALRAMGEEGGGILLYLNQEGRGIGLANKMRAYSLQDQGFDTVEANHRLGFEDDERDFRIGAEILRRLRFAKVRLLTNNPAKVDMLSAQGIEVTDRVPLKVGVNPLNERYLATKAEKSGHLF